MISAGQPDGLAAIFECFQGVNISPRRLLPLGDSAPSLAQVVVRQEYLYPRALKAAASWVGLPIGLNQD
ncbi:hypothetical protein E5288_WYG001133 [Bos mutus]|uniref:Uncharacterized protein n=1 Tax=Bos mutus TaxID=72004 RepID=A0A6B0S6J6_9CETA|nr:hypothetical protein [Bos mutus]